MPAVVVTPDNVGERKRLMMTTFERERERERKGGNEGVREWGRE